MKFIFYYYFTEREYEANSDEELANILKVSVGSVNGAAELASSNNGICILGNDPMAPFLKKDSIFIAKTREDMEELFNKRYQEMLNGSAN